MRDTFVKELAAAAPRNPDIMLVTGDLGFGVLTNYAKEYPRQFINAGVAEQNMTAVACGLALEGHKVFTYSIANFPILRCLEQIRNDICYHNADVTAVAIGGGFSYGALGVSHFATEDLAIMRALPEMKVLAPTGLWEAAEVTKALLMSKGPAYLRLDKGAAASDPKPGETFVIGKARQLREGRDVCFIASGAIMSEALAAADSLAKEGLSARVISMHTVKPLDTEAVVRAARECGGIVTVEEHNILGGLGSAVSETCLENDAAPQFFVRIGLADVFPTVVGDQQYLRGLYGMDSKTIHERTKAAIASVAKRGLK